MADYIITSADNGRLLRVNSQGEPVFVQLPTPAAGFKVTVHDTGGLSGTNTITFVRNGSELIDTVASDLTIAENWVSISLISDGTDWFRIDSFHRQIQNTGRGLFAGGETSTVGPGISNIEYFSVGTAATGTSFGTLTAARSRVASNSNTTRAVFSGGQNSGTRSSVMDYVTIATTGNATSFGSLGFLGNNLGSASTMTRAVTAGGDNGGAAFSTYNYFTVSILASVGTFGSLSTARTNLTGGSGVCSATRGVFAGGDNAGDLISMEYITVATLGNGTSFGNLSTNKRNIGQASNSTRGLLAGGTANSTLIEYVTIATTSNTSTFGNLNTGQNAMAGFASAIRATFGGNDTVSTNMQSVVIATASNSSTWGVLATARYFAGATSSCHGGLNG